MERWASLWWGGGSWLGYKVGGRRQKGNPSISICCIFCMRCVSISKIFPMHYPYVCCENEWSNSRDENWCDARGKHWVAENLARVSPVVGSIFKMKKAVGTVGTKGIIILKANVATKKHLVPKASCHCQWKAHKKWHKAPSPLKMLPASKKAIGSTAEDSEGFLIHLFTGIEHLRFAHIKLSLLWMQERSAGFMNYLKT